MAIVEIKFRPWTGKASLNVEVGDEVRPIFRLRAALQIVVGEVKEGKRERADLSGADLRCAVLRDAVLSDAVLSGAPFVENIDAKMLAAIEANKAAGTNGLKMSSWHGNEDGLDETNWCKTTHCRAGYAVCLAGKAGFDLEKKIGPAAAGALIYLKSTPGAPIPNFYCGDDEAMADIRARAAKQTAQPA